MKKRIISNTHYDKPSVTPRKSLLTLTIAANIAIIGSMAGITPALADTVSCENAPGTCSNTATAPAQPDIKASIPLVSHYFTDVLTTNINNVATTGTNSIVGNTVTLDYTGPGQPTINFVIGAVTDSVGVVAKNNQVSIKNGKVKHDILGARVHKGDATNNHVTISGGTVLGNVYAADINDAGDATNNSVTISGGLVNYNVYGGHTNIGNATNNSITLSGGEIRSSLYSGYVYITGDATNNSITVSGGSVRYSVFAGYSYGGSVTDNNVTISGGTVLGNVYGGASYRGDVTGNSVTIAAGSPITFGRNSVLYGGSDSDTNSPNNVITGNTLNIHRKGIKVSDIKNFENYRFYIDNSINNGDTMLKLTSGSATDISKSNYGVGVDGSSTLAVGDEVILIENTNGLTLSSATPANTTTGMSGISTLYDFDLHNGTGAKAGKQLVAKVTKAALNPQTKAILEGGLAGLDFVNRGTDLAQHSGLAALQSSTQSDKHLFMATSAGGYRTDTGSHIDVRGVNSLIGLGTDIQNASGTFNIAGFAEFGFGTYDAFNDVPGMANVNSDGNTRYFGAGIMGKQFFNNGLAINAGISAGRSHSTFNSDDIVSGSGQPTHFSSDRNYISAFVGTDYDIHLDNSARLTLSGNLKHTHYGSDDFSISNETFNLDSITSTRSTLGAQWSKTLSNNAVFSAGAAWEHEFNGTASGDVKNMAIAQPSLGGNTGIINVGYRKQASDNLTFDIGAQGSFGNRRGGSLNATFDYKF